MEAVVSVQPTCVLLAFSMQDCKARHRPLDQWSSCRSISDTVSSRSYGVSVPVHQVPAEFQEFCAVIWFGGLVSFTVIKLPLDGVHVLLGISGDCRERASPRVWRMFSRKGEYFSIVLLNGLRRYVSEGIAGRRADEGRCLGVHSAPFFEQRNQRRRQRHVMIAAVFLLYLHSCTRDRPRALFEIELLSARGHNFAGTKGGEDQNLMSPADALACLSGVVRPQDCPNAF